MWDDWVFARRRRGKAIPGREDRANNCMVSTVFAVARKWMEISMRPS